MPIAQAPRRRFVFPVAIGMATLLGLGSGAVLGMDPDVSKDAELCQWYPVVRIDSHCTGIYVGNRVVLTAAHCLYEPTCQGSPTYDLPNVARFGEIGTNQDQEFEVDITSCEAHFQGEPVCGGNQVSGWIGVDLAYCILDDDSNLDDIVGIPPMVPEGCERDWLSRSVRGRSPGDAIIMAVGMGCDDDSQCQDPNIKRLTGEQFVDQLEISESDGEGGPFYSAKRLPVTRFGGDQGLNTGDSGGPALARLPDGTWRVIGVYHGTNSTLDENFPS